MRNIPVGVYLLNPCFRNIRKRKAYKILIFFFTLLIYTTYHMSRKPISVVKSVLNENCTIIAEEKHLIITPENATFCDWAPFDTSDATSLFGYLDLAYLLAYALSMFLSGHIAERVNIRYFLSGGMILCGISTSLFGLGYFLQIHVFWYYILVQIFAGCVQATGWPSVVACMANWFGKSKRGFLMGLWNSHTSLGNIFGSLIAGIFVSEAWGLSFIVPGAIIAFWGILVFLFLTPYPEDVGCQKAKSYNDEMLGSIHSATAINFGPSNFEDSAPQSFNNSLSTTEQSSDNLERSEITASILNEKVHLIQDEDSVGFFRAVLIPGVVEYSLCLFFAKLVSYTFLFWLPKYIRTRGAVNPSAAADLSAIMDAGGIFGGIIAGIINDYSGASALTCSTMLILAVPYLYVFYLFGVSNLTQCIVMLVFLGVLVNGPYALITTAVSADLGTHEELKGNSKAIATVTAIIDGTGSLGAALGPLLTGFLVPYGWEYVFIMLMIATCCAALLLSRRVFKEIIIILKDRQRNRFDRFYNNND